MKTTIAFKINGGKKKKQDGNKPDIRAKNRMRRQPVDNLSITLFIQA